MSKGYAVRVSKDHGWSESWLRVREIVRVRVVVSWGPFARISSQVYDE